MKKKKKISKQKTIPPPPPQLLFVTNLFSFLNTVQKYKNKVLFFVKSEIFKEMVTKNFPHVYFCFNLNFLTNRGNLGSPLPPPFSSFFFHIYIPTSFYSFRFHFKSYPQTIHSFSFLIFL